MASTINASTSSGIVQTADTSGVLQLQSNGTTIMTISSTGVSTQVGAPAFSAYGSALQSFATSTFTKVAFNTEEFDTANCFDSTTNYRFTPNVSGYYQVNVTITASASASGRFLVAIFKNGSLFKYGNNIPNSSQGPNCVAVALIYMNGSTDYIEVYGYQDTGGSLSCGSNGADKAFSAALIRSA